MKILLTIGHQHAGYEAAHACLVGAGLSCSWSQSGFVGAPTICTPPGQQALRAWLQTNPSGGPLGLSQALESGIDSLPADLDAVTGHVLVYVPLAFALAQALGHGPVQDELVEQVTTSWLDGHRLLLALFHRVAARCILVNALACEDMPAEFLARVAAFADLPGSLPAEPPPACPLSVSASAVVLAGALVQGCHPARALYLELESQAHLPADVELLARSRQVRAWDGHAQLWRNLDVTRQQLDGFVQQVAEQQRRIDALQVVGDARKSQIAMLESELGHTHEALADALEAARLAEVQVDEMQARFDAQARRSMLCESELAAARDQAAAAASDAVADRAALGAARTELAMRESELQRQSLEFAALHAENDVLLGQLVDMQHEADAAIRGVMPMLHPPPAAISHPLSSSGLRDTDFAELRRQAAGSVEPAVELRLDLRGDIDGDNWYFAEQDGRWAGPETRSVLRVPALADGQYQLQVDVVDAMDRRILSATSLELNGTPLRLKIDGRGLRGVRGLLRARFATADIERRPVWEFRLGFPSVVSPAQRGSDDKRRLAIRVKSLTVAPVA